MDLQADLLLPLVSLFLMRLVEVKVPAQELTEFFRVQESTELQEERLVSRMALLRDRLALTVLQL